MRFFNSIKLWAKHLKRDVIMLWFAQRHPLTPWLVKLLCIITVAYGLSPIDLIPDFIPVLGYLDDVLLLPAFIWLAIKLLPAPVIDECRMQAEQWITNAQAKLVSYVGAAAIILLWLAALYTGWWYYQSWF